jgi:hypothetical protein
MCGFLVPASMLSSDCQPETPFDVCCLCSFTVCLPQVQSPLEKAEKLSEALGNNLLLKREDLQPVSAATNWQGQLSAHTCANI